jgi:hypothetical protein
MEYETLEGSSCDYVAATLSVLSQTGVRLFHHHNLLTGTPFDRVEGRGQFRLTIPDLPLAAGKYVVDLSLTGRRGLVMYDQLPAAATFTVEETDFFGHGFPYPATQYPIVVDGRWNMRQLADSIGPDTTDRIAIQR